MFERNRDNIRKGTKLQPVQILSIGFAAVIVGGALLLSLPISSSTGEFTPLIDCLFTSTSAVCVTGLVTLDTGTHWSMLGQMIIMVLIQIGGLGFMTFGTMFAILLGRRISFRNRLIIQEAYNAFRLQGIVKMVLYVIGITFSIEAVGAIFLSSQFIPVFGLAKGIYYGVFHAVSAFCNAGFDLLGGFSGEFSSITYFYNNPVFILTIAMLIILGGLGFAVVTELLHMKSIRKLSLNTKVVLTATGILTVLGAIIFFAFEYNNPKTLGPMGAGDKILSSVFASVTPRTAGFNSISLADMTHAGKFLTILLMFIGASPGSTGGGIKTTTAALLFITVLSVIKGRDDAELYHKRIAKGLVYRALAITTISFIVVCIVTIVLSATQNSGIFEEYLYEAVSAFGTVGLSLGLTQRLNSIGKIAIMITMYIGRVGPLTLAFAFTFRNQKAGANMKYPEDKILVG